MKKNYKTKSMMRLLITLMLMATLLLGCSSTEAETETAKAKPEVEAPAEEPAEVEEEAPAQEPEVAEPEVEETSEEAAEPEEETPISEESVELIEVESHDTLTDYIDSLDPNQAEIIIYNGVESYMIHMKEGQHYELKANDEIIFNVSGESFSISWDINLGDTISQIDNYIIFNADYSKFEQNQEFYFKKKLDNGEIVERNCYLTPPAK